MIIQQYRQYDVHHFTMILYNSFFCLIYDFLKIIGSLRTQSDNTHYVILIMSALEFTNVVALWHESISREKMVLFFVLIWTSNLLIYYMKDYFKKVIANENNRNTYLYIFWTVYSFGSMITLAVRTSFFY